MGKNVTLYQCWVAKLLQPCAHVLASPKEHERILNKRNDSRSTDLYHWRQHLPEQRKFIAQNCWFHNVMFNIHSIHNTLAQIMRTWERNCRKMVITRVYTIPLHCATWCYSRPQDMYCRCNTHGIVEGTSARCYPPQIPFIMRHTPETSIQ